MSETTQTATDAQHTTVEIYMSAGYARGQDVDTESERFAIARDLRGFGTDAFEDFGRDPQNAVDVALDRIGEPAELPADEFDDVDELLGFIYETCQGATVSTSLPYNGAEHRSMGVGDVIVVDGTAYMVERIGFAELDVELDEDEDDDEPELVTDGGVDVDRQGELLASHLMSLDRVRGVGRKRGRLGATVTVEGDVDNVPSHLFRVADRFDVDVLHRRTERGGRGLETIVELVDDERREQVLDYCERYDRDVEVLQESGAEPELVTDGGVDVDETVLQTLAERGERLHPNVNPGATLVVDERQDVEIVGVSEDVPEDLADAGIVRWARYDVVDAYRTGAVGEDVDGELYNLKRRDGEVLTEPAELQVLATDGGWIDEPETEWCPDCQRERVSCAHLGADVATDGGEVDAAKVPDEGLDRMEYRDRADELVETTVLKPREAEVRALKEQGLSHTEIGEELDLSKSTVDEYSRRINDRLKRARATVEALDAE